MNRIEIVISPTVYQLCTNSRFTTKTIDMKKTYRTIKWILKQQIEATTKTLWTWKKGKKENFTCIYKNYNDSLTIYTPTQLLKKLEDANTK